MKKLGLQGSINGLYNDNFVPITEITNVALADVDGLAYFNGTIGQKKEIRYCDADYTILYKDVFEYNPSNPTELKTIKRTLKNFYLGLYDITTNIYPVDAFEGAYYYVKGNGNVNGITFVTNDIIMFSNDVWNKAVYNRVNNRIEVL